MKVTPTALFMSCLFAGVTYAQISQFDHVVVIVQENRTPDNLFQGLCANPMVDHSPCSVPPGPGQYNIQTNNWKNNQESTGFIQPQTVALANSYDLSHQHSAFVAMCDFDRNTGKCRNDGAAGIPCTGKCPPNPQFRYVDNSSRILDPYLQMATQYGFANYMFQTNQGPSFPAHQFIFGGTSAPSAEDDHAGTFASENMTNGSIAGCIATKGTTVELITATGGEDESIYPCFEHNTIPDLMPSSLHWRYYTPGAGSIWTAPDAIKHICESTGPGGKCAGPEFTNNVDTTPSDVLTDIGKCRLRNITWVIPTAQNSDHAGSNDGGGPSWVASIVNAIGNNQSCDENGYWNNTAIVITWDDWGGWYDHVSPTILPSPQGDYQYGFRVPLVVVSAYTPQGYIDNQQLDFGSILRFVEGNFGLQIGGLYFADARSENDLSPFFRLNQKPRKFKTISSQKDADFFIHDKRPLADPDDDQ